MYLQKTAFQDPTRITNLLKFFLLGCIVFNTLSIFSDAYAYHFYSDILNGVYKDINVLEELKEANNNRQGLIALLRTFVLMGTGLAFAFWLMLSNLNCRALGGKNMRFTPGWCVGWFFVPIWHMWKPYQAIKEIWNISCNVKQSLTEDSLPVMKIWWTCYLINSLFDCAAAVFMSRAVEIPELLYATKIVIMSDLLSYPLCISAILMITNIYNKQMMYR